MVSRRRQWHPTPVLLPGKSMDAGAWKAAVHGVAEGRTRLSDFIFTFMHWRRKWQPIPVFLPEESQGQGSLVGCCLWGRTESDTTEATQQQQQQPWFLCLCSYLSVSMEKNKYLILRREGLNNAQKSCFFLPAVLKCSCVQNRPILPQTLKLENLQVLTCPHSAFCLLPSTPNIYPTLTFISYLVPQCKTKETLHEIKEKKKING